MKPEPLTDRTRERIAREAKLYRESISPTRDRPIDLVFDEPGRLVTEHQLADALRVSLATLRRWRTQGERPLPFIRLPNGHVRFRMFELRAWLDEKAPADGAGFRRGGAAA